jgi:hypothetical protein
MKIQASVQVCHESTQEGAPCKGEWVFRQMG